MNLSCQHFWKGHEQVTNPRSQNILTECLSFFTFQGLSTASAAHGSAILHSCISCDLNIDQWHLFEDRGLTHNVVDFVL